MNKIKEIKRKNVIYLRVAHKSKSALKEQEYIVKNYTDVFGVKIDYIYKDDGYSGSNFDRPGFKRLINDIKDNKVNAVYVKDFTRLGRDVAQVHKYIFEVFCKHNVTVIGVRDDFSTINLIISRKELSDAMSQMLKSKLRKKRLNSMSDGKKPKKEGEKELENNI